MFLDGKISYDEAMAASDSSTNLSWLINQNSPNSRVDAMDDDQGKAAQDRRNAADFASVSIDAAMLDHAQ